MHLITCHNGQLHSLTSPHLHPTTPPRAFSTGLPDLDALLPDHSLPLATIHELLYPSPQSQFANRNSQTLPLLPLTFATLLAHRASTPPLATGNSQLATAQPIFWSDPHELLYPPALAATGIPLDRLYLLHPRTPRDELYAVTESLRCPAVGVTVCCMHRLTRVEARRLQLAAETGGGVGLLLRPLDRHAQVYAASTRWLIEPAPVTDPAIVAQRWKIQLLHCPAGQTNVPVFLELARETNTLRTSPQLAHRPSPPQIRATSA